MIEERIETIMSEEIGSLDHPSFDLKYEIEAALKRMSLEQKAIDSKRALEWAAQQNFSASVQLDLKRFLEE